MTTTEIPPRTVPSHELVGDYWFHSEPVPVAALRGNVILLLFWDLSSVPSLKALPYVEEWHARYGSAGLVVIGVHSPRYRFASNPEIVLDTLGRTGIRYPVVCDNQQQIAGVYNVRSIPSFVVIDGEGFVRCHCDGDGDYEAIEHAIRSLLHRAGRAEDLPEPAGLLRNEDDRRAIRYRSTPNLEAGYIHRDCGNAESMVPEALSSFADPGIYIGGRIYVDGSWYSGREFLRFEETGAYRGSVLVRFNAQEVYAVLEPERRSEAEVTVILDGQPLSEALRGEDVLTSQERSIVRVKTARPYQLVQNGDLEEHLLCLTTDSPGLSFYSFSFVAGAVPETISKN